MIVITDTELAVTLKEYEHEIASLKHRTKELEEQSKTLQELALSVKELALNMKNMLAVQTDQGIRLELLEQAPSREWERIKHTVVTTIAGILAGAVTTGLLMNALPYLR